MSRVAIVEENLKSLIEEGFTVKKGAFQLGLIIGQSYEQSKKWIVFTCVCPKDSLAENLDVLKSSEYLNSFREYSKQVEASLSGGLICAGVYIHGDSDSLKNCTGLLHQLFKVLFEIKQAKEYLYINVCNSSKKIICKSASNVNAPTVNLNFHPTDLKYNSFGSLVQSISTILPINLTIHLNNNESIKACIDNAISTLENEILNYQCFLNSDLLSSEDTSSLLEKYCDSTDLFLDLFSFNDKIKTNRISTVGATITISGNIYSRIYYYRKEPLIDAIQCLRIDIIKSLRDRINFLENESLISDETGASVLEDSKVLNKDIIWYLPSRVYVPSLDNPYLLLSDYMFQEDTPEDSFNRLSLLHRNLNTKEVLNNEQFLTKDDLKKVLKGPFTKRDSSAVGPTSTPANPITAKSADSESNRSYKLLVLITAIIVLLLSLYMANK